MLNSFFVMKKIFFPILAFTAFFVGCIGDDIEMDRTEEAVRILNPLDTLALGETFQFESMFTNNVGAEEQQTVLWNSSDPTVISIDETGLAHAIALGSVEISATVELEGGAVVSDHFTLFVGDTTVAVELIKSGELKTSGGYNLAGSFTVEEVDGNLTISFSDDYEASTALPGLYVYLGNNPSSISNALELQRVDVYSGAHSYQVEGVGINDYQYLLYWCKPFNVKVGDGLIE